MSNRRKIRETVLQALYASIIGDHSPEHVLQTIIKPEFKEDATGLAFAERLYLRSLDYRDEAEEIIKKHISNWEIDRLAMVDRIILQMAITEILSFDDIPTKVTINEAIDIAKKFSTGKSGRFVNGILDAVVNALSQEERLDKRGRGLVDQPGRRRKKVIPPPYNDDEESGNISETGPVDQQAPDEQQTGRITDHESYGDEDDTGSASKESTSTRKKRIKRPRK